jgi:hypothetical protein
VSSQPDSELSAAARQIIADARDFGEPTAEDRERVRSRWLATIAVGTGMASLTGAARAASGATWGLKSAGVALAFVAGLAGVYVAFGDASKPGSSVNDARAVGASAETQVEAAVNEPVDRSSSVRAENVQRVAGARLGAKASLRFPEASTGDTAAGHAAAENVGAYQVAPALPVEATPTLAVPGVASLEHPVEVGRGAGAAAPEAAALQGSSDVARVPAVSRAAVSQATEVSLRLPATARSSALAASKPLRVAPSLRKTDKPTAAVTPQPVGANGRLGEELALLSRIRSSVQSGDQAQALSLLAQYQQTFEQPQLGMEVGALEVDALCHSGKKDAARAQAAAFQARWPKSPLAERVRTACP